MDSKSTGGSIAYLIGPNTCVPLSWACKKHGTNSHSSTEAEVISLDMALRLDGIPHLHLWEDIVLMFTDKPRPRFERRLKPAGMYEIIAEDVDYVQKTLPELTCHGKLVVMEDNDAVIKMIIKGRSNKLRYAARTQRIDLDWLFCIMRQDPGSVSYTHLTLPTKRIV